MLYLIFAGLCLFGAAMGAFSLSTYMVFGLLTFPIMIFTALRKWSQPMAINKTFWLMSISTAHIMTNIAVSGVQGDTWWALLLGLFLLIWGYKTTQVIDNMDGLADTKPYTLQPPRE